MSDDIPTRVCVGRDEVIAWMRARHDFAESNEEVAVLIIQWLHPVARGQLIVGHQTPAQSNRALFIGEKADPVPFARFEFDRTALHALYPYLDKLGERLAGKRRG